MGYKNKRILVFLKVSLEPLYMVCIKIICRLVEQKYLRLFKQKLRQQNLGSLSARQLSYILVQSKLQQVKCSGNLLNLRIYYIEVMAVQKILKKSHLLKKSVHLILVSDLRQLVTYLIYPLLHIEKSGERIHQHSAYGHARLKDRVLIQISDLHILRPGHCTLIRHETARHYIHEG